jgi:hypothetical protein
MSQTIQGFVAKKAGFNGKSKKPPFKPYTMWSLYLEDADGNALPDRVGFGFNEPQVQEGQYVEVKVDREGDYLNAVKDSLRVVDAPVRRDNSPVASSASASNPVTSSDSFGASRQTQIVLQHSQEMAIATVALLLNNKALPITAAATKAGEAKRFEEITAAIDKLTVSYHNDVVTGRLLDIVADAGADRVSTKADGPIPPVTEETEGEKFDD